MEFNYDSCKLHRGRAAVVAFDLLEWIRIHEPTATYIYLPSMVYRIHCQTRLSLEQIIQHVIRFYQANRELVSMERTSEIFITGGRCRGGRIEARRKRFYPMHHDSFISHMILRVPARNWPAAAAKDDGRLC